MSDRELAGGCGAPLVPVAVDHAGGDRHRGLALGAVPVQNTGDERNDVAVTTQLLARSLEEIIRAAPQQCT